MTPASEGAAGSWIEVAFLTWAARTGRLWGTHLPLPDAADHLAGRDMEPPPPEWDVGHFSSVAGVVRGPARSLLLFRDTYPSFGWGGHHLQPADVIGAALQRGDARERGCLLFLAAGDVPEAERELKEEGFDIGAWDNGTPYDKGGGR